MRYPALACFAAPALLDAVLGLCNLGRWGTAMVGNRDSQSRRSSNFKPRTVQEILSAVDTDQRRSTAHESRVRALELRRVAAARTVTKLRLPLLPGEYKTLQHKLTQADNEHRLGRLEAVCDRLEAVQ